MLFLLVCPFLGSVAHEADCVGTDGFNIHYHDLIRLVSFLSRVLLSVSRSHVYHFCAVLFYLDNFSIIRSSLGRDRC